MKELSWLGRILAISFLIPLAFVWKLFAGERIYAHTPIHPSLGTLPPWADWICLAAMVFLLVAICFAKHSRGLIGAFLILSFTFSLWDQSRWMPYFYQFFFMFFAIFGHSSQNFSEHENERVMNTLRIICLSIWFWSGVHKISAAYVGVGYPWMMAPVIKILPAAAGQLVQNSALLSPVVEAGGAVLLLIPATRIFGILLLTGMHIAILVIFGPAGLNWNPSVWSWNVAMIAFLWILFFRSRATPGQILLGSAKRRDNRLIHQTIMIMFLVLPVLNPWGYWDDFLSHCLYSWTTREAEVAVLPEAEAALPPEVSKTLHRDHQPAIVSVLDWSFSVFNSPPYHSFRVFHSVFGKLCEQTGGNQGITLRIFDKPQVTTAHTQIISYQCAPDLGPRGIREIGRIP